MSPSVEDGLSFTRRLSPVGDAVFPWGFHLSALLPAPVPWDTQSFVLGSLLSQQKRPLSSPFLGCLLLFALEFLICFSQLCAVPLAAAHARWISDRSVLHQTNCCYFEACGDVGFPVPGLDVNKPLCLQCQPETG